MVYLVTPCVIINAFQIDDTPEIRKGLLYSMAIAAAIHVVVSYTHLEAVGYEPEHDLDNPADSVFCAHGAGFVVPWRCV